MENGRNFEALAGSHVLSGVEICQVDSYNVSGIKGSVGCIKFTLDGVTYRALENPSDGYRSWMEELETTNESCKYKLPNTDVVCMVNTSGDGLFLEFVDVVNGKIFMRIGTSNYNDYYPCCVFEYTPENLHYNKSEM